MSTDDIKTWVMARLEKHGPEVSFAPGQILHALANEHGSMAVAMLPEALLSLIWEGRLVVTGPWRVRMPAPAEVKVKPPELVRLEAATESLIRAAQQYVAGDGIDLIRNAVEEYETAQRLWGETL